MGAKSLGSLVVTLCVIAAVGALTAGAADARVATQARFTLEGSHGYQAAFSAAGRGSEVLSAPVGKPKASGHGGLSVAVSKGQRTAVYFHSVHFKPRRISGRIGGLGRVKVRFHGRRKGEFSIPHCTGHIVRRFGVFVGTIRFHGERGYTRVRSHRARGTVDVPRHMHCHGGGGGVVHATQLDARTESGLTEFVASRRRNAQTNFFLATESEDRGQLFITRVVWTSAPKPTFEFASDLSSAHVKPPAPFSGSADFSAPDQWTGSLAVSFPGFGEVPLTGDDFSASLQRR